mmetsp:Transcript_17189/g.41010  ORF Transcript_17189/g.41010 Transcript_17189/m.41010 type:complete len:241 (-) Transcript_17189:698-1420(-)
MAVAALQNVTTGGIPWPLETKGGMDTERGVRPLHPPPRCKNSLGGCRGRELRAASAGARAEGSIHRWLPQVPSNRKRGQGSGGKAQAGNPRLGGPSLRFEEGPLMLLDPSGAGGRGASACHLLWSPPGVWQGAAQGMGRRKLIGISRGERAVSSEWRRPFWDGSGSIGFPRCAGLSHGGRFGGVRGGRRLPDPVLVLAVRGDQELPCAVDGVHALHVGVLEEEVRRLAVLLHLLEPFCAL